MNVQQKQAIREMRIKKLGYTEIANSLGLSANTVKSYCFRNGLNTEALVEGGEKCKRDWWNRHRFEHKSKNITEHTCSVCGSVFLDYSTSNRKFCSQACYRKRGEADDK